MTNNCSHMRLLISALLHNELNSDDSTITKAHIEECNDCKAFFLKIHKLEKLLKSAIPTVEIPSVKNNVMKKIGETEKNMAIKESSMSIRFNCTNCKRHFEAGNKYVGKKMKCPKCGTINVVPANPTIAPKQVRPPSNISDVDTGRIPVISKNIASDSTSSTPLVGEIPTVKEIRKIASELSAPRKRVSSVRPVSSHRPVSAQKIRRPRRATSDAAHARRPRRRSEREYRQRPEVPEKSSNQKYLIIGVSALGFIMVLVLSIFLFTGNGNKDIIAEQPDSTSTDKKTVTPDMNPHQPKVIFDEPEDKPKDEKEDPKPEPKIEPLEIVSTTLPCTEFYIYEENISFGIEVKGGVKPYQYFMTIGRLPKGLTLERGVIKGKIRETGVFSFTIQIVDANNNMKTQEYSITVFDNLQIGAGIPKKMELNKEYEHKIIVTGGKQPYTCAILDQMLPSGVEFDQDNFIIKGVPTQVGGPYFIELSFTDSVGQEESWSNNWDIEAPEEIKVDKPKDDKDDKELEKPEDEVKKPVKEKEKNPGLSQSQIRLLLMQYSRQASQLHRAKKYKEAIAIYEKILEIDDQNANAFYNIACAYSLLKNKDDAIKFLEAAIRAGYRDLNHILSDKDLDYIKRDKRFRKLTKNQDIINELSMDALKARVAKEFPADQGYLKTIDHENRLVYATNLGENKEQCRAILNMLRERIENYAKAQWKQLFKKKPKYYITVVLPKKQWFDQYKRRKGFPINVGGWYNPADKFLIAGTMGHTLTHEFTHAMHFADMDGRKGQKDMHIWFKEGLATCFEDCKLPERSTQKPEPIYNNRITYMLKVLENPRYKASYYWNWRKFFSQAHRTFMHRSRVGVSYAMSRCITLWLYRTKKLRKYYENYMDSCDNGTADGKNGITAMERTFRMKLEDIERIWMKWMLEQKINPPKAYIGIKISSKPSIMGMGVVVAEVTKGSSAEAAGMKVGDIIVTFNRMAIDKSANLMVAITECKIGQKVECVVIRDGKPMGIKVKLKRRPKDYS